MTLDLAACWGFALLALRTAGLAITVPVISARVVPARVRLALALLVAWAAWTAAGLPGARAPSTLGGLVVPIARETALGLLAGLGARFMLLAALSAGQLASAAMGMSLAQAVDPSSGVESNALSELLFVVAQAGAVALGVHREAIAWLARSVAAFPPGAELPLRAQAAQLIWEGTGATVLAVKLAFPILSAVLLGHVVMSGLGRSAPQLNLGAVGFSVAILAGGGAFYLVAPPAAELAARAAVAALTRG